MNVSRISQDPSMKADQRGGGGVCIFNLGEWGEGEEECEKERERENMSERERGGM